MDTTSLLTAALQLPDLWRVPGVEFRDGADVKRKLRITIGFAPDSRFHCPDVCDRIKVFTVGTCS